MIRVIFHIQMGNGIVLELPGTWSARPDSWEHYQADLTTAGRQIAERLGGTFSHVEYPEEGA